MSQPSPPRLHATVTAALDATGLPWRFRRGKKHWKLFVGDRLATVLPNRPNWALQRHVENTVRAIRTAARGDR